MGMFSSPASAASKSAAVDISDSFISADSGAIDKEPEMTQLFSE